jgi:hypothetical protein
MAVFGDLERLIDDLYPYRWLIAILTIVAITLLAAVVYRRGWHLAIARHKLRTALVVVPLLIITIPVGWYLLSPLWTRTTIYEESPLAAAGVTVPGVAASTSTPRELAEDTPAVPALEQTPVSPPTPTPVEPTPTSEPTVTVETHDPQDDVPEPTRIRLSNPPQRSFPTQHQPRSPNQSLSRHLSPHQRCSRHG